MYLEIASCDTFGSIIGQWTRLAHDGIISVSSQNMLISSDGAVKFLLARRGLVDWSFDLGDLTGTDYLYEVEVLVKRQ